MAGTWKWDFLEKVENDITKIGNHRNKRKKLVENCKKKILPEDSFKKKESGRSPEKSIVEEKKYSLLN